MASTIQRPKSFCFHLTAYNRVGSALCFFILFFLFPGCCHALFAVEGSVGFWESIISWLMIDWNLTTKDLSFRKVTSFLHLWSFGLKSFLRVFCHCAVTFPSILRVRNVHFNRTDQTLRREGARCQRAWNGNAWRGSKSGERRSDADDSHDGLKAPMTWGPSPSERRAV